MAATLSQPKLLVSWMPACSANHAQKANHRPRRPPNTATTGATSSATNVRMISKTW